jgi:methionyl-tRNA formyltransferase
MINALAKQFSDLHIIVEHPESKRAILRRRAKRFGWLHAAGQLGTTIVARIGKKLSASRAKEIIAQYDLSVLRNPSLPLHKVRSLNDLDCRRLLEQLQPQAILTISCRLLSPETLSAAPCPVINFHSGINPIYRGQMGAYWSRVHRDLGNFGATLHLVDAGIDTGATLYENRVHPSKRDTMSTYPLLLTAASTDLAAAALRDAVTGTLKPYSPPGRSVLRFPPPVWTWLYHGLTKGVW